MFTAKMVLAYVLQSPFLFMGHTMDASSVNQEDAFCLAQNVFFESRNEPLSGQIAVASVTMNRVRAKRYPESVCGVVKQSTVSKYSKKRVCEFSWVCRDPSIPIRNQDGTINTAVLKQFETASQVAAAVLSQEATDNTKGATHFHNTSESPYWASVLKRTIKIGNHVFYKT